MQLTPVVERTPLMGVAIAAMVLFGAAACSTDGAPVDTATQTTTTQGQTSDATETSSSTTNEWTTQGSTDSDGTDSQTDEQTNTSGGFYAGPDIDWGSNFPACDPFAQDCPDGEKCVPYASTGETWDENKCVPVTGSGQVDDPCSYGGPIEATDDCDHESHCLPAVMSEDPQLPAGVCTAFCTGTPDDPICDPGLECLIAYEGTMVLCLEPCDPLLQACAEGLACMRLLESEHFFCLEHDLAAAAVGEPCDDPTSCLDGLCLAADQLDACEGASCCTAYCEVGNPEQGCDPALECVPFYAEGEAPEGSEALGICMLPAP